MDPYAVEPSPLPPSLALVGEEDDDPVKCLLRQYLRDSQASGVHDHRLTVRLWAMHDIGKLLQRWRPELESLRTTVIAAYEAANSNLVELRRLNTLGEAAAARDAVTAIERRHADDGPDDRRHRMWPTWVAWAAVGGAGIFETWFFGQIFRFVSNIDTSTIPGRIEALIAYVPGLMLAVTVALAGTMLGEPFARWKDKKEGRPTGGPRPVWWVAAPFAICLLAVVGLLALARAQFLQGTRVQVEEAGLVPEWSLILLLLMVTIGAVVVKAVTHNPFATSAERAKRNLDNAYGLYRGFQKEADESFTKLRMAWHDLQGTYLEVRSKIQNIAVIRSYALSPEQGQQATDALNGAVPRLPQVKPGDPLQQGAEDMLAELEQTANPQPALGLLFHAEQVLAQYAPHALDKERRQLIDAIDKQFAVIRGTPPVAR